MKNLLIIEGSPRANGNSSYIINKLISMLDNNLKVDKMVAAKLDISPCIDCGFCFKNSKCKISDDMPIILNKIDNADIIIITSPLYFNSVSAQLKLMIDRCQVLWASKKNKETSIIDYNKKRAGYFICTAGSKDADFTGAVMVIDLFFKAISTAFKDKLLIDNTDQAPAYKRDNLNEKIKSIIKF